MNRGVDEDKEVTSWSVVKDGRGAVTHTENIFNLVRSTIMTNTFTVQAAVKRDNEIILLNGTKGKPEENIKLEIRYDR